MKNTMSHLIKSNLKRLPLTARKRLQLAGLGLLLAVVSNTAQAQVVFESKADTVGANGLGTLVISKPAGTVAEDFLIAVIGAREGTTDITGPAGWTEILEVNNNGNPDLVIFYRVTDATDVTAVDYTFAGLVSNNEVVGSILRYSGVEVASPIDVFGSAINKSTSPTSPSVTTTQGGDLVLRAYSQKDNNNVVLPPPGTVQRTALNDGNKATIAVADASQVLAGATGTAAFTGADDKDWVAATVAIRADTSPDLTIDKSVSALTANVTVPAAVDYTIVVTNTDTPENLTAQDVTINDVLPDGLSFISGSVATAGICPNVAPVEPAVGSQSLTWGTYDMAENCQITVTFSAYVGNNAHTGTILNTATANGLNFAPVSDQGAGASADVTVACDAAAIANTASVTSQSGDTNLSNNSSGICTQVIPYMGLIAGRVWLDEDQDGINDIEEAGLTNVSVELRDGICSPGVDCLIAATDQFGNYIFSGLVAGNYDIVVVPATLPAQLSNTAGPYGLPTRSVNLANNQEIRAQDFGYIANPVGTTRALGDRVWSDANGNGLQDLGEVGLSGVTLQLISDPGPDGIFGTVDDVTAGAPTTTTTADGDYLFTGLSDGTYAVVITDTANALTGYSATFGPHSEGGLVSAPVTLNAALPTVSDIDFGFDNANTLTITDRVWYDADGDLTQDAGEPGIAGVTVQLLNSAGNVIATSVTDINGDVSFTGIPDGLNYELQISDLNNKLGGLTETTATGGDETIAGALSTAAAIAGNALVLNTIGDDGTPSFGFNNPGSIAGTAWSDSSDDGIRDSGEVGIAGLVVTLTPPANVDAGAGPGVAITTITAADGSYLFDNLPPADYMLDINTPPTGASNTEDPDLDDDNNATVSLPIGASLIAQDFGYFDSNLNPISGTVFLDTDKDGIEEVNGDDGVFGNADDEPGFAGVTLDLAITYQVIDGQLDIDSDGNIDANDNGTYLGYQVIGGRLDLNNSGAGDIGDDGFVNGVEVIDGYLDVNGDNVANQTNDDGLVTGEVIASVITDISGNYSFSGLIDGNYVVSVSDTGGLLSGYDITSGLDARPITVAAAPVTDIDFGYIKEEATGSIRGEVFIEEFDFNGLADDNETNLTGVTVYLCLAEAAPCTSLNAISTTTTDANGEYTFTDLPADQYAVDTDPTTIPAGLTLNVDPVPITLAEGQDITDVDVGYVPDAGSGVLSGFVWADNGDGIHQSGEAPIGGVDIFVYSNDGTTTTLVATGTTKADGTWIVTGIVAPNLVDNLLVTYDDADIPANLESSQPTNLPLGNDLYTPVNLLSDPDNNISYLDFAFRPVIPGSLASIAGTIYSDADENGAYLDSVDGELEAVTLNLLDINGNVVATTSTDELGNYSFGQLQAGTYSIQVTDLDNVLRDLNPNEVISNPIILAAGQALTDQDAGYVSDTDATLASIGNRFFFDTNGDGFDDPDEPGVEGITIQCWLDADNSETPNDPATATGAPEPGVDNLIRTVVTDENGEFYCSSLPAGQYIVVVADALGFSESADGSFPGVLNAADGFAKPWTYAITLPAGNPTAGSQNPALAADFAISGTNSISGSVFIEDQDLVEDNGNNVLEPGELDGVFDGVNDSAAEAVTVVLLLEQPDGSFVEVRTTTTDINGNYSFNGLPDGNYRVEVRSDGSVVNGFGQTADPDLAAMAYPDNVCDSPTAGLCDDATTTPIALAGGVAVADVDFGYQKGFVTTPVTVNMFQALAKSAGVQFNWQTSNEVGHLGYQLYGRINGGWVLLTDEVILSDSNQGALGNRSYSKTINAVDAVWFALIDVSTAEELTIHGPYRLGSTYGEEMVEPGKFDWSGIAVSQASVSDISRSVQSKMQRLLQMDRDDPVDDEPISEETSNTEEGQK